MLEGPCNSGSNGEAHGGGAAHHRIHVQTRTRERRRYIVLHNNGEQFRFILCRHLVPILIKIDKQRDVCCVCVFARGDCAIIC